VRQRTLVARRIPRAFHFHRDNVTPVLRWLMLAGGRSSVERRTHRGCARWSVVTLVLSCALFASVPRSGSLAPEASASTNIAAPSAGHAGQSLGWQAIAFDVPVVQRVVWRSELVDAGAARRPIAARMRSAELIVSTTTQKHSNPRASGYDATAPPPERA